MASKVACHCRAAIRAASSARRIRSRARTVAISSSGLDDVGQVAVGPALQARDLVLDLDEGGGEVEHGDAVVAGSALIRRQTSNPLMSGRLTSRMTRSGRSRRQPQGLGCRSRPRSDLEPGAAEDLGDRVPLRLVVVDDQDRGRPRISHARASPDCRRRCRARPWRGPRVSLGAVSRDGDPLGEDRRRSGRRAGAGPPSSRTFEVWMMTGIARRRRVGLEPVEHLEAGQVGIDQVEEDAARRVLARPAEALAAAGRLDHPASRSPRRGRRARDSGRSRRRRRSGPSRAPASRHRRRRAGGRTCASRLAVPIDGGDRSAEKVEPTPGCAPRRHRAAEQLGQPAATAAGPGRSP